MWVILLIMSSTRGHFVFFLVAPKTGTRNVTFLNNHFCCHHCYLPEVVPTSRKKKINAEGVAVCGSHWCICRRCRATFSYFSNYSKPPENFVAYCWKKQKSTIVTEPRYSLGHLRRCKIFKHAQLSLIGSYSSYPRRWWNTLSISLFSPKRGQPAFIKNKKQYDASYVPAHYCFPGRILKPLTKKKTLKQDYSLWVILLIMS